MSEDDPPAWLGYGHPDVEVDAESPLGLVVHHPKFGIALKERLDALGVECVVQYLDGPEGEVVRHGGGDPIGEVDFVRGQFEQAKGRR